MNHADVWRAIDTLAAENGLSPSGLARSASLDPTAFNPSKRYSADGRRRWPSTETIAKILEATNTNFRDFSALISGRPLAVPERRSALPVLVPLVTQTQVGFQSFFDSDGLPTDLHKWDQTAALNFPDPLGFAMDVTDSGTINLT